MKKSVNNPNYDLIGKLALGLYSQGIKITLDALKQILNDNGEEYSNDSNLGIGKSVSAAYHAWEKIDPLVHIAIANTFIGRNGEFSWDK